MSVDPVKMLQRCKQGQWSVDDFDWSKKTQLTLSKKDETRLCQLYMDMSYIERIAGDLFLTLSKRLDDPVLKEIYQWCYTDEVRHSHASAKLMDYFDVHQYKVYTPNRSMLRFIPYFSKAIKTLNPALANSLIMGGELILDIALLRGINESVDDPQSRAVVGKINQDESRHLAMDFFMAEYCSDHNMSMKTIDGKKSKPANIINNINLRGITLFGPAFFNEVFFQPMQRMDPSQEQMKGVIKRLRRFNLREEVKDNPVTPSFNQVAEFLDSGVGSKVGWIFERTIKVTTGIDFGFVRAGSLKNIKLNRGDGVGTAAELADSIVKEAQIA